MSECVIRLKSAPLVHGGEKNESLAVPRLPSYAPAWVTDSVGAMTSLGKMYADPWVSQNIKTP